METAEVKRLPEADRAALASDLGELLLLVAHHRWQEAESKVDSGRETAVAAALRLNQAARSCFPGAAAPRFIERQAAEMAGTPAQPIARGEPENATMRDVYLEAAAAVASAKYSMAVPLLVKFVNEHPGHGVAQYCLAYCKEQLGRHDSALERYEMAQSLLPQDPRAAYQRGVILGMRRQFAEAEQAFSQAIELDAKLALAYRNRAFSRSSQEKFKEAEDDLTRGLELGAAPLQIHTYRAQVRDKLGNPTGARADRALADSLSPAHEADFISRGLSRLKAKDYRPALADFRAAEELNRRSLSALLNQVHVLAECLGEPEAALEVCGRLIRAYPEYASGRIDRAVLLGRLGNRPDAIAEAERALKLSKDPDVKYRAACVYALSSVVDESTKSADQARALDLLHRALRDGSARRDILETDRDLDPIRQTERFQEISDAVMSLYR